MNIITMRGIIGIKQIIVSIYMIMYDKTRRKVIVSLLSLMVIRLNIRLYALTKGSTLDTKDTNIYPIFNMSRFGRDSMLCSDYAFKSACSFFYISKAAAASGF